MGKKIALTFIKPPHANNNIELILQQSVDLFEQTGLENLAHKWDKILFNYQNSMKV